MNCSRSCRTAVQSKNFWIEIDEIDDQLQVMTRVGEFFAVGRESEKEIARISRERNEFSICVDIQKRNEILIPDLFL